MNGGGECCISAEVECIIVEIKDRMFAFNIRKLFTLEQSLPVFIFFVLFAIFVFAELMKETMLYVESLGRYCSSVNI